MEIVLMVCFLCVLPSLVCSLEKENITDFVQSVENSSVLTSINVTDLTTVSTTVTLPTISSSKSSRLLFTRKKINLLRRFRARNVLKTSVADLSTKSTPTMLPVTSTTLTTVPVSTSTVPTSISSPSTSSQSSFTRKKKNSDLNFRASNSLFSNKRRSRIRTFGKSTIKTTVKPSTIIDLGVDLLPQSSHHSEISLNHPYLSKPLAMHKRPAGKSDFMGLGVMPPRGSPAAKGPFKPAIIYKGLIRKQRPGMQFKRTPNGPPPLPPPLPPQPPERPMARGREVSIPSEFASQFSMADPNAGTYKFGYDTGVVGEQSYRYETRDESGKVIGKYGYIDPEGVLREVNYVADAQGYRPVFVNRYRVDVNFPFALGPIPSRLKFS